MATFAVTREVDAPAEAAWRLLTHWPAHTRWVPLTRVTVTGGSGGVGTCFVGRTGLGRLGFDDPMEVVRWQPPTAEAPGRCTVRKRGRVVLGWVEIGVVPLGAGRARLVWTEDVEIAPAAWTAWASPLVMLAGRLAFANVLRQVARELRRAGPGAGAGHG